MPRVTISIPSGLRERLADPRIRNSLNISRICQDALRREVSRILDLPLTIARVELLIDRLKKEKETLTDRWVGEGARLARDWIEHEAPYAQLRQLGEVRPEERRALLKKTPPPSLQKAIEAHREETNFSEASLVEGFGQTVAVLWQVIQPNL